MKKFLVILFSLLLVFGALGLASAYPTDGLVAEYLFNGDAQDSSGYGNHGTVNGATLTADRFGNPNHAYLFEGRDGIDIPNNSSLEPAHFTLSAWINWMGGNDPYYNATLIIDNYSTEPYGYDFGYDNKRKILMFHLFPESAPGVPLYCDLDLTSGGWVFVAVTYDGANMKMYANDSFLDSAPNPDGYKPSTATNTTIGTASHAPYSGLVGSHFFQGIIDDVRIYDRALSETEIQQLYRVDKNPIAEIIGTWYNAISYYDVAKSEWTKMWSSRPPGDIASGDFTGDGIADVASCWKSGLWYQDADTLTWTNVSPVAPNRVTAGDITGDGRAEIIGVWESGLWYRDVAKSKWTRMYHNKPTGDFAAGDFTGDGKADVASCWKSGLWYQDGATLSWTKVWKTAPSNLTCGDVTGDGRSEIIGTWSGGGIFYWDVAKSKWTKMWSNVPSGDIAAGDFTGDGKADVASKWSSGLWYQDGASLGWTKVTSAAPYQLTAGDVTGD